MTRWFHTSRSKQLKGKANFMLYIFYHNIKKKAKQSWMGRELESDIYIFIILILMISQLYRDVKTH